jgi:hypothetical protein
MISKLKTLIVTGGATLLLGGPGRVQAQDDDPTRRIEQSAHQARHNIDDETEAARKATEQKAHEAEQKASEAEQKASEAEQKASDSAAKAKETGKKEMDKAHQSGKRTTDEVKKATGTGQGQQQQPEPSVPDPATP